MDPRRLIEELAGNPHWVDSNDGTWRKVVYPGTESAIRIRLRDGRPETVRTVVEMPLRGTVIVEWSWQWASNDIVNLTISIDGDAVFLAEGRWRNLGHEEQDALWRATEGEEPVRVPGDRWPASIDMHLIELTDDVYLVRGVRTGFQHLVIDTKSGLIVADAPAGWLELHHLPPTDLVPGLGISGLSERFVDFIRQEFPGRNIDAVAITHFHDDHAGGARAFAAEGADVFASGHSARFLAKALNRHAMPEDRYSSQRQPVDVIAVVDAIEIGDEENRVRLVSIGANPHVFEMLGVWAVDRDYFFVSDIHVPRSDDPEPGAHRAVTECWFANWAVSNLPEDVQVVNSHSPNITPVSRLAEYLESGLCRTD